MKSRVDAEGRPYVDYRDVESFGSMSQIPRLVGGSRRILGAPVTIQGTRFVRGEYVGYATDRGNVGSPNGVGVVLGFAPGTSGGSRGSAGDYAYICVVIAVARGRRWQTKSVKPGNVLRFSTE